MKSCPELRGTMTTEPARTFQYVHSKKKTMPSAWGHKRVLWAGGQCSWKEASETITDPQRRMPLELAPISKILRCDGGFGFSSRCCEELLSGSLHNCETMDVSCTPGNCTVVVVVALELYNVLVHKGVLLALNTKSKAAQCHPWSHENEGQLGWWKKRNCIQFKGWRI